MRYPFCSIAPYPQIPRRSQIEVPIFSRFCPTGEQNKYCPGNARGFMRRGPPGRPRDPSPPQQAQRGAPHLVPRPPSPHGRGTNVSAWGTPRRTPASPRGEAGGHAPPGEGSLPHVRQRNESNFKKPQAVAPASSRHRSRQDGGATLKSGHRPPHVPLPLKRKTSSMIRMIITISSRTKPRPWWNFSTMNS
jgi:hypothetical protein